MYSTWCCEASSKHWIHAAILGKSRNLVWKFPVENSPHFFDILLTDHAMIRKCHCLLNIFHHLFFCGMWQ